MRIAVNTRFLLNECLEGYGYFLYETFRRITNDHPEHEFIFIFDRSYDKRFVFAKNVIPVVAGPRFDPDGLFASFFLICLISASLADLVSFRIWRTS